MKGAFWWVLASLLVGCLGHRQGVPDSPPVAAADTTAIRAAAAAHYATPDSAVARAVVIRVDTAWTAVYHGRVTFTIVRLERGPNGWRFAREDGYGIH